MLCEHWNFVYKSLNFILFLKEKKGHSILLTLDRLLKETGTNSKEELRTLMQERDIEGVIWHRSDLVPTY